MYNLWSSVRSRTEVVQIPSLSDATPSHLSQRVIWLYNRSKLYNIESDNTGPIRIAVSAKHRMGPRWFSGRASDSGARDPGF